MAFAQIHQRRGRGEAWLLAALLLGGGAVLYRVAGGPHYPTSLPNGGAVLATLTGSTIPYSALGAFCTTFAWALWLWLTGTLCLQLLLAMADTATSSARWVRSLRGIIDPFTLPAIRRLVHGTAIAFTVAQLTMRTVPAVSAAPVSKSAVAVLAAPPAHVISASSESKHETRQTYTVQRGDSLWVIAQRFYGDGEQWPKIVAANVGQRMPDGHVIPRNPVLQPGWVLRIPDTAAVPAMPASVTYVVRDGDTLSGIAQHFYGDAQAWPRIFDANRGAHLADGWTLSNPNLIWPGLRLTIPDVAPPSPNSAPPAHEPTKPASPTAPKPATPSKAQPAAAVKAPTNAPPGATTPPAPTIQPAPRPAPTMPPTPEALLAIPTPIPTAIPATASPTPAPVPISNSRTTPPIGPALELASLAALGAGTTVLLTRRWRRKPGRPSDRDAGIPIHDGYADPAHAPTFAHRLYGGGEPALLVAEQVQRALAELGLTGVQLVAVREGRHTMTLTFGGNLTVRRRLLEMDGALAERLAARVKARLSPDGDATIELSRLGQLRLVAPPADDIVPPLPLVALGVLPTREAMHVNWKVVGNTLIVGMPGDAVPILLASVLTAITARRHPDQLRVSIVASRDDLPAPLHTLPHLTRPIVDQGDAHTVRATLDDLSAELERREAEASDRESEELLVLSTLDGVPEPVLIRLLERGPEHGIHVLVATTRPEEVPDALVSAVGTVLAFRLADEDQGVRLVGTPDAATLDGGELLARIESRTPVRLRAFKVENRHLERLVEQMHTAYRRDLRKPGDGGPDITEEGPYDVAANMEDNDDDVLRERELSADISTAPGAITADAPKSEEPALVHAAAPVHRTGSDAATSSKESSPTTASESHSPPLSSIDSAPDASPSVAPVRQPLLYVRCFGPLQVRCGDRELSCMRQFQAWELLAYLITHGGSVSRQGVLDTFWPGTDDATAGNRLDQLVHRLKKVLTAQAGEGARDLLCREHGKLALDSAVIASDLQRFHALLDALPRLPATEMVQALEAALDLANDELLAGAEYAWLERPGEDGLTSRERYQEQVAGRTHELACRYRDGGEVDRAVLLFRQLLAEQPTLQPAARGLYRCFALLKDRRALEQAHAELIEALRRERTMAGTADSSVALHPKTIAAYQKALEEVQRTMEAESPDATCQADSGISS